MLLRGWCGVLLLLLLLGCRNILILSARADRKYFARCRVLPSLMGFLFFVGFVAFVGGDGDHFFVFWNWGAWEVGSG